MPARRGFTLMELVLVLLIMVMLAAMAIPSLEAMYGDMRLQAGADHLRAKFAEARTHAIDEGRPYRFAVKPETAEYRLAPDLPEFWGEQEAAGSENEGEAQALVLEDRLPGEIVFQFGQGAAAASTGEWTTLVVFNPDGSCSDDRTIRLEMEDARPVEISVRGLTGAVTAKPAALGTPP